MRRWVPGSSWRGSKFQSATGGGAQPAPLWLFSSLELSSKPVSKPLKEIGRSHTCFLPKWSTELGIVRTSQVRAVSPALTDLQNG